MTEIMKPNGEAYHLNPRLIEAKNVSDENVLELIKLHNQKNVIFSEAEKLSPKSFDDREKLKDMSKNIEEIEFKMQALWGFDVDATFHEWYLFPHCTCPKLDNSDMRGTKYQVVSCNCPIHGSSYECS